MLLILFITYSKKRVNNKRDQIHKIWVFNNKFNPILDGGGVITPAVWKTRFSTVNFDFCDPKPYNNFSFFSIF